MSQQKVLLTVCLVAGFVGAVYSQNDMSVNPVQCGQKAADLYRAYLEKTLKTNTDFAQKLGALGTEAADVNKFTEAGSNLANTYGQLLPNSSNISASNYISTANSIVSQQAQLGMMFFNPGLGMKGMSLYSDYIMETMRQNMQFLTDLPQACLSGN